MKKAIASILCCALLVQGVVGTELHECETAIKEPEYEGLEQLWQEGCCATDPALIEEMHSALLERNSEILQANYGVSAYTLRPHYGADTLMPSVGTAKMLVLPIAFPDYPQYREAFDAELEAHRLFDPYDPDKLPADQSVRGFYHQASNQRLDITGTVLQIYDAPLASKAYENASEECHMLITAALEAQDIDFSEYDSNGDGFLDALMVICLLPRNLPSTFWWSKVWASHLYVGDYEVKNLIFTGTGLNADLTATYTHETGHLLGLADTYGKGSYSHFILDSSLEELMNSRAYYINAYFKYLLDWIDPIMITYDDEAQEIELPPVELCSADAERAVVLIPSPEAFPFCEYYIAEYRAGGATAETGTIFDENPGIVIWHCVTYIDETQKSKPYRSGKKLEPIHKSGSSSSVEYSEDDVYVAGDKFGSNKSNFKTGSTGAYLEVVSTTPEKAVLRVGYDFLKNNGPRPTITISNLVTALRPFQDYERDAVPAFQVDVDLDGKTFTSEERSRITSGMFAVTVTETINPDFSIINNPDKNNSIISRLYRAQGEGTIRIQLQAGLLSKNAKDSAAVTSEVIYIDNTPPEIELHGKNPQIIQKGTAYIELGAVATDNLDPDIESKLQIDASAVDTDTPGTYTVIYSVTDHVDFTTTAERTVIVEEEPPTHVHAYSDVWSKDETEHWRECECGVRADEAAHTPIVDPEVKAACTTPGKTEGSHCGVCGYVIETQTEIPATGHRYSSEWHRNSVNHWHQCVECDTVKDNGVHIEDAGTVTKPPTLDETGIKTYSCSVCGYEMRTEILAKLKPSHAHSYADTWSKNGTSHWHECVCGDRADEVEHTIVDDPEISANCDVPGKTAGSHCEVCGYTVVPQLEIPALKHQIPDDWHCDEEEYAHLGHWHTCINCGAFFDLESHSMDDGVETKAPTATTAGEKAYTCTVCGWTRTETIPATGGNDDPTPPPTPPPGPGPAPGPGPSGDITVEPTKYAITLPEEITDGTVKVDQETAEEGSEVTLTAEPKEGFRLSVLSVADGQGIEIELTDLGDGEYTFVMPSSAVKVSVVFEKIPEEKKELPFTDVKKGSWYYDAMDRMYQEGLMAGTTETTFSPFTPTSRAMLVTILYRLEGEPAVIDTTTFPDVKAKWCAPAVAWAAEHGIVMGYWDGLFRPNQEISREEVAVILFRYAQYKGWDVSVRADLSGYSDSGKIHKYAQEAMEWLNAVGIMRGRDAVTLAPDGTANRAEIAVMMERVLESSLQIMKTI